MKYKKIYTTYSNTNKNKIFFFPFMTLIMLILLLIILSFFRQVLRYISVSMSFDFNIWIILILVCISIPIAFFLSGMEGSYLYLEDDCMRYAEPTQSIKFKEGLKMTIANWKGKTYLVCGPKILYDEIESIDITFRPYYAFRGDTGYSIDITFILDHGETFFLSSVSLVSNSEISDLILWLKENQNIQINDPYHLLEACRNKDVSLITYLDTIMMERGLRTWIRK